MTRLKAMQHTYDGLGQLDENERNRLLMENLPQVHYIARRIHDRLPRHLPLEDLVNAGVVGLLEAIRHFDASRGTQVKTFAELRIRGAILDSLREMDWSPRALRRKSRQLEESHSRLRNTLNRSPSEQELAEDMQISIDELRALLNDLQGLNLGSIQALEQDGDTRAQIFKLTHNSPNEDPYCFCLQSELKHYLAMAVDELADRERKLLALYYKEELTMKEIGAVLGIGEGRVSQLHSAAMARLRARMLELFGERPGRPPAARQRYRNYHRPVANPA
jgi:RNA polymerase sigma factor FliA